MSKRILLAGILGGIAMFVWTSVAHMMSRVCAPTVLKPSLPARIARSSGIQPPPTPPTPAGDRSAHSKSCWSLSSWRAACSPKLAR